MATPRLCKIEGCGKPVYGLGWCNAHWARWRRNGDPLGGRLTATPRGETHRFLQDALLHDGRDCLIWPYWRAANGYGRITFKGKRQYVHRLMCELVDGPAPSDKHEAAHSCGNGGGGCINPHHLEWKTRKQNEADKEGHGTRVRGERHGQSKLSAAQVRSIRAMRGSIPQSKIAKQFGIGQSQVARIQTGEKWGWLE